MGSVILFDAVRMQEIEDTTVVNGLVDVDGHLLLQQRDGTQIDAGMVRGADGPPGISSGLVDINGHLILTSDDGSEIDAGLVRGSDGEDGTDGTNATSTLTAGMILDWPGLAAVPSYACLTDGRALSRSTYSTLYGRIGNDFGAGDGSTTFNVPNLKTDTVVIGEIFRSASYLLTGAVTDLPTTSVVAVSDGSPVRIDISQIFANAGSGVDRIVNVYLLCDGVNVNTWTNIRIPLSGGGDERFTFAASKEHTPTAGSHTWKVQVVASAANAVYAYDGSVVVTQVNPTSYKKIIITTDMGIAPVVVQGGDGLSVGMIIPWPGVSGAPIPATCLELNGQVVDAAIYSALAAMFPSWVSGTNLTLPDLRGKTIAGYLSGDDTFGVLGSTVGEKKHTLTIPELPAHTHAYASQANIASGGSYTAPITNAIASPSPTSSVGSGTPHNVVQPTYVGRWLIIVADSAGEYSPTVQAALTGRMTKKESIPAFLVKRIAAKNMSGAQIASKIDYDSIEINRGNCWNAINARFIAPLNGLYEFTVSLTQATNVGGPLAILYKNGTPWPSGIAVNAADVIAIAYYNYVTSTGVKFMELNAGDYVEVFLVNTNGTTISIASYGNAFSGKLVEAY